MYSLTWPGKELHKQVFWLHVNKGNKTRGNEPVIKTSLEKEHLLKCFSFLVIVNLVRKKKNEGTMSHLLILSHDALHVEQL